MIAGITKRLHDDRGTSLIELLVSMLLVGILSISIVLAVSTLTKSDIKTTDSVNLTNSSSIVLDRITRMLRSAAPVTTSSAPNGALFVYGDGDHVTLYSTLGDPNGPAEIDINVPTNSTSAAMTVTTTRADATATDPDASYTYTKNTPTTQIAGRGLDTTQNAVFTYYTIQNNALTALATPLSTTNMSAAGCANTSCISAIGIKLSYRNAKTGIDQTRSTVVYLRDTEYSKTS